ncbi:hypothetical protein DL240_05660 [Lujinxingia litoralis]|uniref:LysM domain-containing protein n=1 Tax=Lujinxingia litoralis TaxID=2211119 RepID=A0A328C8H4_9DELT|nr:LysM peptidoglycan-binding domain-containing protein [Lujinxingia litoralis]RAL23646.1 hypothetical protein DL240_05660 [Lujinxingia litoralis]
MSKKKIGLNLRRGARGVIHGSLVTAATAAIFGAGALPQAQAQSPYFYGSDLPDYHVVSEGDTIWDLSGSYYGDPYQWPRMWSYNAHITNPHWVYPGDIVYLQEAPAPLATTGGNSPGAAQPARQEAAPAGTYLPVGGMITAEELTLAGRIIGSPKEASMLGEHDSVWVRFGEEEDEDSEKKGDQEQAASEEPEVAVGERFAIVRLGDPITDDEDNTLGHKYIVLGSLVVTEVSEDHAETALIDQSWREIERGDVLVPYERQLKVVQPRQAENDLIAHIVDTLQPGFAFGTDQYVFIDRGAEDSVRVGNRFFIYQRFEGLNRPGTEPDKEIPWQRVGQVMVLDVRENYSTAIITRASREIVVGDRLEMYAGY